MSRHADLRSQSLDMLRFPLAVVVLIVHTIEQELIVHGIGVDTDGMPILSAMKCFVMAFLTNQSVPVYFFISGFVFFLGGQLTKQMYVQKMKNRFKSLFIPYIIWNIIALLSKLAVFLLCLSFIFKNAYMKQLDVRMSTFLYELWDASKGMVIEPEILSAPPSQILTNEIFPADAPLWFVRDLMIVAISTPVLYWLLKRTRHYMVLTLGLLWFYSDILWGACQSAYHRIFLLFIRSIHEYQRQRYASSVRTIFQGVHTCLFPAWCNIYGGIGLLSRGMRHNQEDECVCRFVVCLQPCSVATSEENLQGKSIPGFVQFLHIRISWYDMHSYAQTLLFIVSSNVRRRSHSHIYPECCHHPGAPSVCVLSHETFHS